MTGRERENKGRRTLPRDKHGEGACAKRESGRRGNVNYESVMDRQGTGAPVLGEGQKETKSDAA